MTRSHKTKPKLRPPLSVTDERVLTFIRSFGLRVGQPPTRQEIAEGLGFSNVMVAQRSVQKLREQGKVRFGAQSKRGIELVEPEVNKVAVLELPLLGTVAAGQPIEAIESAEKIQVPSSLVRTSSPHFVLRVKGESMIEDHICDGDYVVVRQQATANNGDKVVALIDGEATLKRFYSRGGRVELHPANSTMKPIVVGSHQHLRIAGVYAGLIRVQK